MPIGNSIGPMRSEKGCMKDRMKETHVSREFEAKRSVRDSGENLEGTESLVIELLRGTRGLDVLCVEPYLSTRNKGIRNRQSMLIGRSLVLSLCDGKLFVTVVM